MSSDEFAVGTKFNRFVCFPSVRNRFPLDGTPKLAKLERLEVERHLKTCMDISLVVDHVDGASNHIMHTRLDILLGFDSPTTSRG